MRIAIDLYLGVVCVVGRVVCPPVNTPSPDSLVHSMFCVSAACEVGHVWFQLKCI